MATAIGLLATAALFPFAARAVGNSGLVRHAGTVESFVTPSAHHVPASIVKSEAEFLAFGALAEVADGGLNRAANEVVDAVTERRREKREAAEAEAEREATIPEIGPLAPELGPIAIGPRGSFGSFLAREGIAAPDGTRVEQQILPQRSGIQQELLGLSAR